MLTRLSRLEKARSSAVGAVKPGRVVDSFGPIAQSQSPPPTLWSGAPMNVATEPAWLIFIALHCKPVGPITNDSPALLVRMLGSAAPLLPGSRRFGLKVGAGGAAADDGAAPRLREATTAAVAAMVASHRRAGMAPPAAPSPPAAVLPHKWGRVATSP